MRIAPASSRSLLLSAGFLAAWPVLLAAQQAVVPPGSGNSADPYQISELGHLVWVSQNVAQSMGKSYAMIADINASATASWNDEATDEATLEGFMPIGDAANPFAGSFDGQGYAISGLTIRRGSFNNVGLFAQTASGAAIQDLRLAGCSVNRHLAGDFVAGLVGYNRGLVVRCQVTGDVSGRARNGGLVGCNDGGTITHCSSSASLDWGNIETGGLVGSNLAGTISDCLYEGRVSGVQSTGGLVGRNAGTVLRCGAHVDAAGSVVSGGLVGSNSGTISQCYAAGILWTGNSGTVGGLVGFNSGAIADSHAAMAITASRYVGGLAGICQAGSSLVRCYSIGPIRQVNGTPGGLFGQASSGTVSASYWDGQASGVNWPYTGWTTAQMKQQATFAGWDFTSTWGIIEGTTYPYLRWSPPPFTLRVSATGPGSIVIEPASSDGTYPAGTVTLLAMPNSGSSLFHSWTGAGAGPFRLLPVPMDTHRLLRAEFQDAIEIRNLQDLSKIGNDPAYPLSGAYSLTADIDASATAAWNDAGTDETLLEGFNPIGSYSTRCYATFEGNGHTISGLVINRPSTNYVGLFGYGSPKVRNLKIGGAVTGASYVGGLFGYSEGTASACSTSNRVSGTGTYVGGLIGYLRSGKVADSYATGEIIGVAYVGGFAGTVTVDGRTDAGLSNCYSSGLVSGGSYSGGLVGGENSPVASGCYWDVQTSGWTTSPGGTGKTTVEMMQQATFADWDFASLWGIDEDTSSPWLQSLAPDADGDLVPDFRDNCQRALNPGQADSDADRVGDACDLCPQTVPGTFVSRMGCPPAPADFDADGDVDLDDAGAFSACSSGPGVPLGGECGPVDFDVDNDVDASDFGVLQRCYSGEDEPADSGCG